jgi:hypothetical protein
MDTEGVAGHAAAPTSRPYGAAHAQASVVAEPFSAVPEPEPTGHPDVDAALERLRELPERPTGAHPELYDDIHQRLQDALAQIERQDAQG